MSQVMTHVQRDELEDREQIIREGFRVSLSPQDMVSFSSGQKLFVGVSPSFARMLRWSRRLLRDLQGQIVALLAAGDRVVEDLSALKGARVVLIQLDGCPLENVEVGPQDVFVLNGASIPVQWAIARLSAGATRGQVIQFTETDWVRLAPFGLLPKREQSVGRKNSPRSPRSRRR